jgi:hypothetical protein
MPHCDIDIYENLLQANWSKEKLSNILLVANRLADYLDRFFHFLSTELPGDGSLDDSNPAHKMESRAPCLLRLGK